MNEKMRSLLVDDLAQAKYWWSMRFIILTTCCAAVIAGYNTLPVDWLPEIPHWFKVMMSFTTMGSGCLAALGRVIKQPVTGKRWTDAANDVPAPHRANNVEP